MPVTHESAEDYLELVKEIQDKVSEKYGVQLHTEMENMLILL